MASQGSIPPAFSDLRMSKALTRQVLWKLDIHILPALALLWLASNIDRANVGNARIAGLEKDTHLQGNQFNTALTVFYVPYVLVELPSNWVMKKVKPGRWLPLLVVAWGTVTTLTALIHDFAGLVAIRVFLGLCEGALLPGLILYLSSLYKPHELQQRIGIFYATGSLSGAFGGLLASAIIKMNGVGGLAGWRWIFILEGITTVFAALYAYAVLPSDLNSARFFSEEERAFAEYRYRVSHEAVCRIPASELAQLGVGADTDKDRLSKKESHVESCTGDSPILRSIAAQDEGFEWREVRRGMLDPQVWLSTIASLGIIVPLYSFALFLPTIVAGLGYRGESAQLHTVPPYVPAAVLTVVVAILSDKLKRRGPFILILLPISAIGYVIALVAKNNVQRYVAVHLIASGIYPCSPCILSILPNNCAGHYKKATAVALQLAIASCGAFVATFAYTSDQAPEYRKGHRIALAFAVMGWVFTGLNVGYCMWENRARDAGRRDHIGEKYQELWDSGKTRAPIGDRSPDFRFTL